MDIPAKIITTSAQETKNFGGKIGRLVIGEPRAPGAFIFCLYGELGSGKTTFVQGFSEGVGVKQRLVSPTFIIVRRYHIPQTYFYLYHCDLYRFSHSVDIRTLGMDEIFQESNSIVLIEWAERLGDALPNNRIDMQFAIGPKESRIITSSYKKI
jgi:tRNA threonylcarbamoyladenosine biosynthesis protein TsaE